MIICRKELKRAAGSWCMCTFALVFIQSFICLFLFPVVKEQISTVNDAMENVEKIVGVLGMDYLNLDEITDFYGLVCGMVLGIGGGLFAAIKGACILEAEAENNTADFLLTFPISRAAVLTQKLFALFMQVIALNAVVIGMGLVTSKILNESLEMYGFVLLHIAYLVMQLEISSICFGISAFVETGGGVIGMAFAAVLYLMNMIYNISGNAGFLKYVTPYAYCGVGKIFSQTKIQLELVGIGIAVGLIGIIAAYLEYAQKDISATD